MSERSGTVRGRDRVGSRLGDYEIRGRLGAGGMGDVYRAHDRRLGRDVALKILPEAFASDPARVRRFETEARVASALNHPNIVTVYSVGSEGPVSYIAMELVEGKTLREALAAAPLPDKKLLDFSCQLASGLARAHEAGIVHRDLKPENVMVSRDGIVKILDFGLSKRMPFEGEAGSAKSTVTHEGAIVGTVGYMSPEQAAGQALDYRSDQFSFGSILYEMATGQRPFQRKSAVETLAAIINDPPEPVDRSNPRVPGPVRWIVGRCLAKDPLARYASTHDLAQELKVALDQSIEGSGARDSGSPGVPRRAFLPWFVPSAAAALAVLAVLLLARRSTQTAIPDFQRLTFQRGSISSARFASDGRTIVYGAAWEGDPIRLFSARTDGHESTPLEFADADVASVSSQGEIAMLLGRPVLPVNDWVGTLARAPLSGGAPRELVEGAAVADWSPDGKGLAIVRRAGKMERLEFPIGKVLHETDGWIEELRFSPAGDRIAFFVRGLTASVEIVDLAGKHSVLSKGWKRASGLAWSPDGTEVWFGANEAGWRTPLHAVSLTGRQRLLMRLPSWIKLQDVARDGRALVSLMNLHTTMRGLSPGESRERDISWHEGSLAKSMTPDGRTVLFDEGNEGYFHTIYIRSMDGSPAKRIAEGRSLAISADGRWIAANASERGSPVVLLPTGPGEPRPLDGKGHHFEEAAFFPEGKRILLLARDPGHGARSYVQDLETGDLRAIGPEGLSCQVLSPDGIEAACEGPRHEGVICSVRDGTLRPIPGFETGREDPLLWASDRRFLFVGPNAPARAAAQVTAPKVFRLDLTTGRRDLWHEFIPPDRAALSPGLWSLAMTPDGGAYAYSFQNAPSDLYLVTGLK
jgi:eukaryotic-like serine/threonine-protein kinase